MGIDLEGSREIRIKKSNKTWGRMKIKENNS
jgi:hypothetical protein